MTRPLCDHTEDDGPCPFSAIVGYTTCLAHWQPGSPVEGPKPKYTPPYHGAYKEGVYKLERPIRDEPASIPARPYTESTPEPETVETLAENERTLDTAIADADDIRAGLREQLGDTPYLAPALEAAAVPNPPTRRGWRRLFRRAA